MPIYEYQCDTCGSQREIILRHGEIARPTCAACRKRMRRVISKTAFILKGSGWYVTDYPSDARKKGMDGEKPAPAPAADAEKKGAAGESKKPAEGGKHKADAGGKKPHADKKPAAQPPPGKGKGEAVKSSRS